MNKHYYRYMGYRDGSGKPYGLVIKCYSEGQAKHLIKTGFVLKQIGGSIKNEIK